LQAGELGTDVASLNSNLVEALELGMEWNAIILLDGKLHFH
jgi:hypothetical protein